MAHSFNLGYRLDDLIDRFDLLEFRFDAREFKMIEYAANNFKRRVVKYSENHPMKEDLKTLMGRVVVLREAHADEVERYESQLDKLFDSRDLIVPLKQERCCSTQ